MELYDKQILNLANLKRIFGGPFVLLEPSIASLGECTLAMGYRQEQRYLIAVGSGPVFNELEGEEENQCKICPLNHANRLVLNTYLPFTRAAKTTSKQVVYLLDDADHESLKAVQEASGFPLFRISVPSASEKIDQLAFMVYQEGYTLGYGIALDAPQPETELPEGLTTLLLNPVDDNHPSPPDQAEYEHLYLDQLFTIGEFTYKFDQEFLSKATHSLAPGLDFLQTELPIMLASPDADARTFLLLALECKRRKLPLWALGSFSTMPEELLKEIQPLCEQFHHRLCIGGQQGQLIGNSKLQFVVSVKDGDAIKEFG